MKRLLKLTFTCAIIVITANTMLLNTFASSGTDYNEISARIEKQVEENHIPGMAVIVVNSDEVLFSETYGNCNSIDTPFIIGSMSKSFTALSIMQLVEDGKIDLDASVSEYIDASLYFKNASDGNKITVRQLLNQTSGLDTYQRFGNAEITDTYGEHLYANVNYGLLGEIIEAVSGESYSDYVENHIFEPLGMNHTSATLSDSKADGLIDGYRNYFGVPVAGEPDYPDEESWSTVPAGYISSSINDMGTYLQMYLSGGKNIISQNGINSMFYDSVCSDDNGIFYYGMGWELSNELSFPVLGHAGLVENYTSNMYILPDSGIGVVMLVNMNDYLVNNNILDTIILPLIGEEVQTPTGNRYVTSHILIDLCFLAALVFATLPFIFINRWKRKNERQVIVTDFIIHLVMPILIILLPNILGVPLWVVFYFVKDMFIVLILCAVLLCGTGAYKIIYRLRNNHS